MGAMLPLSDPVVIKKVLALLEERIEQQVKQFLQIET